MRSWAPILILVAAGCGAAPESTWTAKDPESLGPADRARFARAERAVKSLSGRLAGRLQAALALGSPAEALETCKTDAPGLARAVGDAEGVLIGRTSHRLRSAGNRPPEWVRSLVDSIPEDPGVAAEPRVFLASDGRMGVTFPITTKSFCLTCHGPRENLPGEVRAKLEELYPEDRATGFTPGELRGLFWVEVPPGE